MRQVVLDTETTGLDWEHGHRIIEIGCVEIVNRRKTDSVFHCYINPQRAIDEAAQEVHGLSAEDLADKPLFADVAKDFLDFVAGSELIIHNAPFDVGFLDNELRLAGLKDSQLKVCNQILDTLPLARQTHPGQRNSLDALCKRYTVDNSSRDLHGALLDAWLLADVYLAMTGGQGALSLDDSSDTSHAATSESVSRVDRQGLQLKVLKASEQEVQAHNVQMDLIDDESASGSLWRKVESS
jgi:DNA polymerase-3 subunit epsilon